MKPDCYKCKYRRKVPGSYHSRCVHPLLKRVNDKPELRLMATLTKARRGPSVPVSNPKLNIKANKQGIKGGWFHFPFNFDPIWLENCDGFEAK